MPQLVDFNPLIISAVHVAQGLNQEIDMNMVRHLTLSILIGYNVQFRDTYGDIIICLDTGTSWRKSVFPYYKANRSKSKADSPLDWDFVYACLEQMKTEMREDLPYRVVGYDSAEADDVIAILAKELTLNDKYHVQNVLVTEPQPILIISSDKDFKQLQIFPTVDQYSPMVKKMIRENRPDLYLKEHMIRGDAGDGVPNFLSDDDVFVTDKRQKPIMSAKLENWLQQEVSEFCTNDEMLRNIQRNQKLVDLTNDFIPREIVDGVIEQFESELQKDITRHNLFNYCMKHKLRNIMHDISQL